MFEVPTGFTLIFYGLSLLNKSASWWLPFLLGFIAWELWIDYRQRDYISKIKWTMLEILIPEEVQKTPLAMEIVLTAFHEPGTGNWLDRFYKGRVMLWSSLEIVSVEGSVKFFIRVPVDMKNNVEAKIYSQYPGIEIYEVEDYTKNVDYHDGTWDLFGTEFELTKPDPYPIRTYIEFGLSDVQKSENQTDPILPVLEFFGSMKKGEQVWFQILVQATKKRFSKKSSLFGKQDWKAQANEIVSSLKGTEGKFGDLTIGEQNAIGSLQRSISKIGLDCGIRAVYLAKKDVFSPLNIGALIGTMKQFSSENSNSFAPQNPTKINFPWEDYRGKRLAKKKEGIFDAFRYRSYFYSPFKEKPFVLNTEELATIYHFPPRAAEPPGFARIESHKSQPPANLPI